MPLMYAEGENTFSTALGGAMFSWSTEGLGYCDGLHASRGVAWADRFSITNKELPVEQSQAQCRTNPWTKFPCYQRPSDKTKRSISSILGEAQSLPILD
ncbi:hypothetical protein SCARD494_04715 [Seiridium cardinale]